MARKIFVNLPVKDLARTAEFWSACGFEFDERWGGEHSLCVVLGEGLHAMLLSYERFLDFTLKPVADAVKVTEVMTCVHVGSREEVDAVVDRALAAGGTQFRLPMDYGVIYGRSFEDLDGHIWEWMWMEE
ncbi:MAG: hypothetical protein JNK87_35115 [Bryobacterales bacterium]|nr:hypothetical protein [Bryobacterales bacterium]